MLNISIWDPPGWKLWQTALAKRHFSSLAAPSAVPKTHGQEGRGCAPSVVSKLLDGDLHGWCQPRVPSLGVWLGLLKRKGNCTFMLRKKVQRIQHLVHLHISSCQVANTPINCKTTNNSSNSLVITKDTLRILNFNVWSLRNKTDEVQRMTDEVQWQSSVTVKQRTLM